MAKSKKTKYSSEYKKLYDATYRKQKYWMDKGFYIDPHHKSKVKITPISKLGKAPSKSDVERLRRIKDDYIYKYFLKDISDEIGKTKGLNIEQAKKEIRKKAGVKAAETKRRNKEEYDNDFYDVVHKNQFPDDFDYSDLPFSEPEKQPKDEFPEEYKMPITGEDIKSKKLDDDLDQEYAVVLDKIYDDIVKLYGFESDAHSKWGRKEHERTVEWNTQKIEEYFLKAREENPKSLAENCQNAAMRISSLLEQIKSVYRGSKQETDILTELQNIFQGKMTVSEAKKFDTGFEEGDGEYVLPF